MKALNGILSIERLTSVGLTRDSDKALRVKVLHDGGMVSEASLLLPRKRGGIGEIEGQGHLGLYLVDVLPAGTT